jgi:predicted GNAT superfamily acetyltransferase
MTADKIVLGIKYAGVINTLSAQLNIDLPQAMDRFYKSYTYQEMREGISDMHCRSDEYLAEEIVREG